MNTEDMKFEEEVQLGFKENTILLVLFSGIALISNWAGNGTSILEALPGMLILLVMILMGMGLKALIGGPLPVIAWVSLISVICTLPFVPFSEVLLGYLKKLSFLSLLTPLLAYAALAITDLEIKLFKQSGVKIAIISILVFTGTYLGSALVAQALL